MKRPAIDVAGAVGLAIAMNAVVFGLGWDGTTVPTTTDVVAADKRYIPPSWLIAAIWIVIFGSLGYVNFLVRKDALAAWSVKALIGFCALYPFLTRGLAADRSRFYNTVALLMALFVAASVARLRIPRASWVLVPLLAWVAYVNLVPVTCSQKQN